MAATDIGRVRDHNEDDYVALWGKDSPRALTLC
jgi:hypothetical protein